MGHGLKGLCMVAHPDDCVIFGMSFMYHYSQINWSVCYLTYTDQDDRGQEFVKFWNSRNIPVELLGFVDDWHDIEKDQCSFDQQHAQQLIQSRCKNFDIVLSHNAQGDYGHVHHRFVNQCINHDALVTFAGPGQGNRTFCLDPKPYDIAELPMHADVILGFHAQQHVNSYCVPEHVLTLLEAGQ